MPIQLSSRNVFDYLVEQKLCKLEDKDLIQVTAKEYKNFNLLVNLGQENYFLVKQERHDGEGKTRNELWYEWRAHDFLQHFSELQPIIKLTSEVVHFDPSNSIIVLRYFNNYCDLNHFYTSQENQSFPCEIAVALGTTLATIHRTTFRSQVYQDFLTQTMKPSQSEPSQSSVRIPRFLRGLDRLGPGVFSRICTDGLDFWRLYQRYDSLHQAMTDVYQSFTPCCLTHNDLRLWNILVKFDGNVSDEQTPSSVVRLIDWEFFSWGDPAYDLGMLLSSYLKIWLRSLVISNAINVETALRLATTPLEQLQPSMIALVKAYFVQFPEIFEHRPDFLRRVMQFAGLVLVKRTQGKLEQLGPFDNIGICTLQVAKTLLCNPDESIPSVFGTTASALIGGQLASV